MRTLTVALGLVAFLAPQVMLADDKSDSLPQNHFVGSWSNVDGNTQSHIRIKISGDDKGFQIGILYKSHPPHWNEQATLHLLGAAVNATAKDYGFASWDHGFANSHVVAHLEKDKLIVESYTLFKDNSGRSNYRLYEVFERSPEEQVPTAERDSAVSVPEEAGRGAQQSIAFDQITPKQITETLAQAAGSDKVNGTNANGSRLNPGSILLYRTDETRYGKLEVLEYGYNLTVRYTTYQSDGSVLARKDSMLIRGTWTYDLDYGVEGDKGKSKPDLWWEQVDKSIRYLVPSNGARFVLVKRAPDFDRPIERSVQQPGARESEPPTLESGPPAMAPAGSWQPSTDSISRLITIYDNAQIPRSKGINKGTYTKVDGYRYVNIAVEYEQKAADEAALSLGVVFAHDPNGRLGARSCYTFEQDSAVSADPQKITVSGKNCWHGSPHNKSSYIARFPIMGPYLKVFPFNHHDEARKFSVVLYLTK